jgi:hypothetical protein
MRKPFYDRVFTLIELMVEALEDLTGIKKAAISKAKGNQEFLNSVLQIAVFRKAREAGPNGY